MKKTGRLSIMKKALSLVLLLSGLLLYGCGLGGETSTTSATSNGGNSASNPEGGSPPQLGSPHTFKLNLVDADGARMVSRHTTTGAQQLQTGDDVRVVMRLFDTVTTTNHICPEDSPCIDVTSSSNTVVYKDTQEMKYDGTGSVAVTMPVTGPTVTGYTIDVIISEGTPHKILLYGQAKDVRVDNQTSSATVTIKDAGSILNMQVKDSVLSSTSTNTVKIDVTVNNALPFSNAFSLLTSGTTTPVACATSKCTINAPISTSTGTQQINVTGTFTLNSDLLKQGESNADWIRKFPDSTLGEEFYYDLSGIASVTIF